MDRSGGDDVVSSRGGLTSEQANAQFDADGPNVLPAARRTPLAVQFARELVHFFALMLWTAALLAWLAGLLSLAVAIAGVVVLNAVFSFVQERRADRAADRLRVLLAGWVTVRRDGRPVSIDSSHVVVGDVMLLEAGDRIPADGIVVATPTVMVDTSMLTGESGSVAVAEGDAVFAGTFVVDGGAEVRVDAAGQHTRLATIAALTTSTPKPITPLEHELALVVRAIAFISVSVGAAFFVLTWAIGEPVSDGLVFAIGVTVALVPEALLPTVTLSLAWGSEQMAKRQVLVRNLEAVETLGSTTFVCTDKTGTLTRNEMTVVEAWTPTGSVEIEGLGYGPGAEVVAENSARPALERLALAGVSASTGFVSRSDDGDWAAHGEPMDAALDAFARRLGLDADALRTEVSPVVRHAFDARRRTTSVVVADHVFVKGAPDSVFRLCTTSDSEAVKAFDAFTAKGRRVLALAGRTWGEHSGRPEDRDVVEHDLELYGLVALEDPPRDGVTEAIHACRRAGVRIGMLTGDHPATARAVAERIGLYGPDSVVISGDELPVDDAVLGALLDHDGVVVARVTPEDKLRIARALRNRGHIVAMTGDGVNDAPALHEASIGIAMGRSGTDVAREAADLVLLDDHFASIVAGIEQGRATYLNIRRFLTYHLTDNVAELTPFVIWAMSGGRFPLALGVLQVLAIDLGTDTLTAVALGAEPPAEFVLESPPISGRLLDRTVARRAFGLLGPAVAAMTMVAFIASIVSSGWRPGQDFPTGHELAIASGAAFMAVIVGQTANAFACRSSTKSPWELGWTSNRYLFPAILFALVFSLAAISVGPVATQLDQAFPSWAGWAAAVATWPVLLIADTIDKHRRGRPATTIPAT
jgi:magnesium-transporting ATPase (P-type)